MKLAILYNPTVSNRYIVSGLQKRYPNIDLIEETQSDLAILRRTLRRKQVGMIKKIDVLALSAYYQLFLRRTIDRGLHRRLGHPMAPQSLLTTNDINSPSVVDLVSQRRPDVILVIGTGILGRRWLGLDIPIINVHPGALPKYRGRFCWFWPIVNNDKESLCVTSHYVVRKVDAGEVISQKFLEPLDCYSLPSLLNATARCALEVVEETLERLKTSPRRWPTTVLDAPLPPVFFEPGLTDYVRYLINR